jgi:hypothetical protein
VLEELGERVGEKGKRKGRNAMPRPFSYWSRLSSL